MASNASVSLSGTQPTPSLIVEEEEEESPLKVSLSPQSSGSFPIRAPLSYDSDIENPVENNGDFSSGSEGFVSGEEGFDSASERPFVADLDEEIVEIAMEEEDTGVPFVSGDEVEEEIAPFVDSVVGSSSPKTARPIAQLSLDDDDVVVDEGLVSEVEDDGASGVVRVSGVGAEETPKVEVFGGEEGKEDVGLLGKDSSVIVESETGENGNPETGILGTEEKEPSSETILAESVEDKVLIIDESPIEPLVSSKEDSLPENAKLDDVNASPAFEEIPVPTENRALEMSALNDEVVEEKRSEVLVDDHTDDHTVSMNPTTEVDSVVYADQPIEVVEKSSVSSSGINEASPVIEELNDSKLVEADNVSSSIGGSVLSSGTDEASPVIEELNDSKLVEADNVSSSIGGNLVVETKEPMLLETGVVEAVKENGVSEAKRVEFQDEGSMSLGSAGSDQASPLVEESVGAENNGDGVGEIISLEQDNYNEKTELVIEQQINSSAQGNELKLAANEVESEPNSKVDRKDEIHAVEEGRAEAEAEAKSQVLIADEPQNSDDSIGDGLEEEGISNKSHTPEIVIPSSFSDKEAKLEAEEEVTADPDEEEVDEGSVSDDDEEGLVFGSSQTAEQFIKELERGSGASSHSGAESLQDHSQRIDGQIVTDSDEADTDEEGDGKELFDSAGLAALLKAATGAGSDGGNITITSPDGSRLFSIERPVGLGPSLRSLKPAPRPNRSNLFTPSDLTAGGEMESDNNLSEEERKKLEKVQLLRVKFLRLVQRLGHSPEDSIASQVLYRLVLAAGRHTSQAFSLETAKRTAMQLEAEKADLDFSLNVLVLGKAGVGKSATINSIFGEEKALIDAFEPGTIDVKEIAGTLDGVNIRVFDTPGLRSSAMEQNFNQKILSSIKKFTKKCPPDIVLYVDRLDTQTRDLNDLPLLKTITSTLGSSIWRSAIVTLTHAASAPPDGPSGSPLSYEVFVSQRSHVVQQSIGQAVGDLRLMNPSLMNPVSLVENHPSCRKNREGERILPNGQIWRPQLLFLCYSMKILSEASSLSKPQEPFDHRKLFGFRVRSPPLPYLLSSLLQSRAHPKLSADQGGENGDSDIDLGDFSDSDQEEEEDEYDQLPPFKPLRRSQLAKLSKEQRKAYFDEYDYRVKLLQKKQLREEVKRLREIKKKGKDSVDDYGYMGEDVDQENDSPAAVPVPLPDMALPPSFDGDNPAYRYRFLEPTSQLLARPVLDTHGWDHDCGYDGVSLEQNLAIASRFPAGIAVQITKDKKEFNIHLDSSVAAKHGENGSTMAGFDIQNIGKQLAYIVKGETKFKNLKKNKTAAGISITFLGENVVPGLKIEDQIALGKRLVLVGSTGAVRSQGDVAYGANLEARLKEKDFPIGQDQSTLGLSLMKWRGDLALGANLQSQFSIGRSSKMAIRVGLNNKLSGQITVKTSSSEQLQIALMGVLPIAISIFRSIWPGAGETYSAY